MMMTRPWSWVLLAVSSCGMIHDGRWQGTLPQPPEEIWTQLTSESEGHSSDCSDLGSLALTSNSTEFPSLCYSRAAALLSDTFDVDANRSACHFKRCETLAGIQLRGASPGQATFTRLAGQWHQILRDADGGVIDCEEVGTHHLDNTSSVLVPSSCQMHAAQLGADTVEVSPNRSTCHLKRCGTFADIHATRRDHGNDAFTMLGSPFHHIVLSAHMASVQCTPAGNLSLDVETSQPTTGSSKLPLACISEALLLDADTINLQTGLCHFHKCESAEKMTFVEVQGEGHDVYTKLWRFWSQVTRAEDGYKVAGCENKGSFDLDLGSQSHFPQVCYSKALIAGADTISVDSDHTRCDFLLCGMAESIIWQETSSGQETHTLLLGSWSQLTFPEEKVAVNCSYRGNRTVNGSDLPLACFSKAVVHGADAFDVWAEPPTCVFKRCGTYSHLTFQRDERVTGSYTLLFPRMPTWGSCDPAVCLDLHLMYTSRVAGKHVPIEESLAYCDPEDAAECFGGAARRTAYVQAKRREFAVANESLVLMDLGSSVWGGPFWDHPNGPKGMANSMLQNQVPYDISTFSPRDFLTDTASGALQGLIDAFSARNTTFVLSNARFALTWKAMNDKLQPFVIKEMVNGWKVGFLGLFPHVDRHGYRYGKEVMEVDPHGMLKHILDGTHDIQLDTTELQEHLRFVEYKYDLLESLHEQDVISLSTLVSVDVLMAAGRAREQDPDIKAMVLLASGYSSDRWDTVLWLAQHGNFDVVVHEQGPLIGHAQIITNHITGKKVLLAGSETSYGVGHVKVRLTTTGGVERFEVQEDVRLGPTVQPDPHVQSMLSGYYQHIRDQESGSRPAGTITNPIVGGGKRDETPSSKDQCRFMDCSAGEVVGKALLWKGRNVASEQQVHASFYNLGGFRRAMTGEEVFMRNCKDTLQFQNLLRLYRISGRDLLAVITRVITDFSVIGLLAGGFRVAIHQPCWKYITNRSNFDISGWDFSLTNPPGTAEDHQRCRESGVSDLAPKIIDIEVQHVPLDVCQEYLTNPSSCPNATWRTLEMGAEYIIITTQYFANNLHQTNFGEESDLGLGTFGSDAVALCEYINASSPVQVDSWEAYLRRGTTLYPDQSTAWADGARIATVEVDVPIFDGELCTAGKHLPHGATECQDCGLGRHSEKEGERLVCRNCSRGFFNNVSASSSCMACGEGTYANSIGATACAMCPQGKFSDPGADYCVACRPGFFADELGSADCAPCQFGKFAPNKGSTSCTPCGPPGCKDASEEGDPKCLQTNTTNALSEAVCKCPKDTYWPGSVITLSTLEPGCYQCPEQMICELGTNLSSSPRPIVKPGFWASPEDPTSIFGCSSAIKCVGGEHGNLCKSGLDNSKQACEHCLQGTYWAGEDCRSCLNNRFVYPVLPFILTPLLIFVAYHSTSAPLVDWEKWSGAIAVQGYILLSHYQVLNLLGSMVQGVPASVEKLALFYEWSNNILSVFEPHCLGLDSFKARITTAALIPVVFIGMSLTTMVFSWVLARCLRKERLCLLFDGIHNVIGNFLFTFFSGIVAQAFTIFKCTSNPNGKHTMKADRSINCYESEWRSTLVVGVSSSLVYCVLVGSLYALAVLIAPYNNNYMNHSFQWRWKFLFIKFRADCYWFGIICLGKNFLVNLGPVIVENTLVIVWWEMAVIILYSGMVTYFMPFRYRVANAIELVCTVSLVFCMAFLLASIPKGDLKDSTMSTLMMTLSFMPILVAFPAGLLVVKRQWDTYKDRGTRVKEDLEDSFTVMKRCCFAIAQMPTNAGVNMLLRMGEQDRHMFLSFSRLARAEVYGVGTTRLMTQHTKESMSRSRILTRESTVTPYIVAHLRGPDFQTVTMCI